MHSFSRHCYLLTSTNVRCGLFSATDFYAFIDPVLIFITDFYKCSRSCSMVVWCCHRRVSHSGWLAIAIIAFIHGPYKMKIVYVAENANGCDCERKNENVRMEKKMLFRLALILRCGGCCAKIHHAMQLHTEANRKRRKERMGINSVVSTPWL